MDKYYTRTDPAMDKYRPAWDALKANSFVNNPELSEYDRIRSAWHSGYLEGEAGLLGQPALLLPHHVDLGRGSYMEKLRSRLLQGHLDEQEEGEVADPIYLDITWRGTCSRIPSTAINNPLITKGKTEFGTTWICGYFEGMGGIGLPNSRCYFDGESLHGPRRVPRNLQSFIDGWNGLESFGEDEAVRLAPSL
ncbi:hypothetical protein JX265_006462 [Neoarthrinium moseri]|uniref:Uncharacterized protein n=1 Tax=Neoarthrinium moseri TaxID=1658444 RepID=A0A9Q0ALN1_9PEZI|nr:hypothetical protein JX265_006462 [Neoarthrinium moseri]